MKQYFAYIKPTTILKIVSITTIATDLNPIVNKTINTSYYEFSFSLSKLTQYDNLSQEYKDKLKEEINKLNLSIAYEDFVDSLIAKGYKYKNFLAAYNNWCKKDFNKDKTNSNIDDKEWSDGVTRCDPNEFKW